MGKNSESPLFEYSVYPSPSSNIHIAYLMAPVDEGRYGLFSLITGYFYYCMLHLLDILTYLPSVK